VLAWKNGRVTATAAEPIKDLAAAFAKHVDGEIETSARRRAEYSSDASNYRVVPQAVSYPKDRADLEATLDRARELGVAVTMRGGGTSVAGNAIGPGLVIDTSRHLTRILDINPEERTARVEPGVVMTSLQAAVAGHGLRFGPDPSTASRATFGGMIGNNACGPHAVAYGRTADNVISLDAIDGRGNRFVAGPRSVAAIEGLDELVKANLALIRQEFGRFSRQVSGYSLEHLLPELGGNLARFLVGTEGTLATVTEATVRLVPVAPHRLTAVFAYPDMPAAADAVVPMLAHGPHAVEGLDARLVERVVRARGGGIPALPDGAGWLFVEVGAETEEEARAILAALTADSGTTSHRVVEDPREAAQLWSIRADGAGLAGRSDDNKECWPGWEDAAVPPASLGAYLRDFDALMERHGVTGQPFGHFGDGCIHVRLDIPLQSDGAPLRAFMEEAAALVASHGGSLSGEHGDGRARSELLPAMYSPQAIDLFGQVKSLFDPQRLLNPGVLVDPAPLDANLRRPSAPVLPRSRGGLAFAHDHGDLTEAVHRCTGVGKCRADSIGAGSGFMCPSYAATGDEKDVTRGRARVLQDAINGTLVGGLNDRAVRESLDLCLSCKACSSDCPSGVDMAAYKSEVLHRRYKGKVRPVTHYSIGWLPRWLRVIGVAPGLVNAVLRPRWIQKSAVWAAGMDTRRTLPVFAKTPFRKSEVARRRAIDQIKCVSTDNRVVLWADSFTDGLEPEIPTAIVRVLEAAGFEVLVAAGDACCGVTWISTGQLEGARRQLEHLLEVLGPYAVNGIPIIGVEPSCMAVLRGDLLELLPDDPRAHAVAAATHTFAEVLTGKASVKPREGWSVPSLADVTAVVQPHCHQHSVLGFAADRELLASAGASVTEASGCCGLAGNWGTERGHYETSVKVAENSLLPALRAAPADSVYIADGVSCRTQADDLAGVSGRHLAQVLAERL
jgi:FAD/FMN-containing dehydrogenase/Fe-S oxidoreductase